MAHRPLRALRVVPFVVALVVLGCSAADPAPVLDSAAAELPSPAEASAAPAASSRAAPPEAAETADAEEVDEDSRTPLPRSPHERDLDVDQRRLWITALRKARAVQIERIRGYRAAGKFPTFSDWGERVPRHRIFEYCDGVDVRGLCSPVFIDEQRVDCAVASLMRASGWGEQANQVAHDSVYVRVEEVTKGPLLDWILRSGLTQDEVALVQPSYQIVLREKRIEAAKRRRALGAHFFAVEKRLVDNTEISLDIAMSRLVPGIRGGIRIEEIGGPPAGG